jgi:hypothetical protein
VDVFQRMRSLPRLLEIPRRVGVTYRDVVAPGAPYTPPLPAEGKSLTFQLFTGPPPGNMAEVTLLLTLKGAVGPPAADVNGVPCNLLRKAQENGTTRLEYKVPVGALPGNRRDAITLVSAEPVTALDVQIRIVPPTPE